MEASSTVRESIVTKFAEVVGDKALIALFAGFNESGLFQLLLYYTVAAAFVAIGWSVHRRSPFKYPIYVFLALVLLAPYRGKPAGFIAIDQFARLTASVIETSVMTFAANNSDPNSASNMHPGLVMDMFAAAASAEIKNPETRTMLHQFLAKCMDNALTKEGEQATYDDLFAFDASYRTVGDRVVLGFTDRQIDRRSLENDDSIADIRPGMNCDTALKEVRTRMVQDLEEQPFVVSNRVMTGSGNTEDDTAKSTEQWFNNWKNSNSPFLDLSRNVRVGIASQYEKSRLVNELGWDNTWLGGYYKSTNMDVSLREMMLGLDSSAVDAGFQFSNIRELPARLSGNRWAFSLGAEMKELKEKLEMLPYYLANIENMLKFICPLCIAAMLFGTTRFFTTWAGSWIAVTVTPAVVTAMRSINNSIILSKLGVQDLTNQIEGNKMLASMVNIDQTKALMEDFIPLAYAMMKQEVAILAGLAFLIIGGSWYSGLLGNAMVGWLGSSITGQIMGQAMGGGVGMVANTLTSLASSSSSQSGSAGGATGGAGSFPRAEPRGGPRINPVNSQNQNEFNAGPNFSSVFTRKD